MTNCSEILKMSHPVVNSASRHRKKLVSSQTLCVSASAAYLSTVNSLKTQFLSRLCGRVQVHVAQTSHEAPEQRVIASAALLLASSSRSHASPFRSH